MRTLLLPLAEGSIFTSSFYGMGSSSQDVLGYFLMISSTSFTLSGLKCSSTFSDGVIREETGGQERATVVDSRTARSLRMLLINILLNGAEVKFKIDSGADVNVMSHKQYLTLDPVQELKQSKAQLDGVGGEVKQLGSFQTEIEHKGQKYCVEMFVVDHDLA